MRRVEPLPVFGLFLVVLLLSACVQSQTVLLTDRESATPLPLAFVLARIGDKPDAARFDRKGDSYVGVEDGVETTYRLVPLDDRRGATGPFYIAIETSPRQQGANYGLIEVGPGRMVLHSFDTEELADKLDHFVSADKFGIEVASEADLLELFRHVAADALDGKTDAGHFKVLDLADPAQRAEGKRLLEETRKAKEHDSQQE